MKKAVIFDLDGTLLNTLADLRTAVNLALAAYGLPLRSTEEVRRAVGNGIRRLVVRLVPTGTDAALEEAVFARFQEEYRKHCSDETAPYAGVSELLRRLRAEGCLVAIVSNKADFAVQALMKRYFAGLYDVALGEMEGLARKPAPDMVEAVEKKLGVKREDAVYVGDSEVDVETAKNAGLFCVSVTWGFRDAAVLAEHGARYFVHTVPELYATLQCLMN